MRSAIVALALLAAACGQTATQPAADTPAEDADAGASGAGRIPEASFTLESEALVGLWSFDRSCGLYDLVFQADDNATYYDYTHDLVVTHSGAWATADNNRVVLTTRRLGPDGAPSGETETYNLDVKSPVTDDLVAHLERADGGEARDITARRCPEEDRE
jgi:hypothetical protein